jgi:hypothetical protein
MRMKTTPRAPRRDPHDTLYGDMKKFRVINTVAMKNGQFFCRDCKV